MMKRLPRPAAAFVLAAAMLASAVCVRAINFDAEETYNSIFVITSGQSLGSGFSMGENCVVTNAHVISDDRRVCVTTYQGERYDAFVAAMSEELDIAVLGVDSASFAPLAVGRVEDMSIGDDVYAIGAPNRMAYTITKGCLSAKERSSGAQLYLQTDAAINSGNSGGPLLNGDGAVIGVNTYKISNAEGIGLAIPIGTVTAFLSDCEIETDENGAVIETLEPPPDVPEADTRTREDRPSAAAGASRLLLAALAAGLVCSVALNVILLAVVLRKRKGKGNDERPLDPTERTDFEIDILE